MVDPFLSCSVDTLRLESLLNCVILLSCEQISIRFRAPLRDKEMRVETVEELHVGEYPEPAVPNTIATPHIPIVPNSNGVPAQSVVAANMPQMQQDKQEMVASDPLDDDDPHRPDLIVSYDVINEEVTSWTVCVLSAVVVVSKLVFNIFSYDWCSFPAREN